MKLLIKVTKDIIEQSMYSGFKPGSKSQTCAIAMVLKSIFPNVQVGVPGFCPFGTFLTQLPGKVTEFIRDFDMCDKPEDRLLLKPIEFEIELTQEILDHLNLDDFTAKILQTPNICII